MTSDVCTTVAMSTESSASTHTLVRMLMLRIIREKGLRPLRTDGENRQKTSHGGGTASAGAAPDTAERHRGVWGHSQPWKAPDPSDAMTASQARKLRNNAGQVLLSKDKRLLMHRK